MSQQHINTDIPNSGNGDALRDAFVKTEDNFTDLYGNKVDKISGKDLSSNDFTTSEKNKLAGIPADAEKNVQADFLTNDPDDDSYIKNKPTFITGVAWGDIIGTLSAQTDLQNALDSLPTFEYVDSKISQTVNSGITDFSPSEDAVFNFVGSSLNVKTDLTLFNSHTANTSNPHNTIASQVNATLHSLYLTGTTTQSQLDNTETNFISVQKINNTNFKNLYQTGLVRTDADVSVLTVTGDTLTITAVDRILFINEIFIDTPTKIENYIKNYGTIVFTANAVNTPLTVNTRGIFYVAIDKLGVQVYRNARIYDQDVCYLARILVNNTAGVYTIISSKYYPDLSLNDPIAKDRIVNGSGNLIWSTAASISFGNKGFTFSKNSVNYSNNKLDPNYLVVPDSSGATPMSFLYILPNITSLATNITPITTIDPKAWYLANGTVGGVNVLNTSYQVYRVLLTVTGTIAIQTKASTNQNPQLGVNAIFANREDAIAGLTNVVFPDVLPIGDYILLGTFYLRAGTPVNGSFMNDPTDFYFRPITSSNSSSTVGVTSHDLLSGKNDNPTFQHVTSTDITNWNQKANDIDVIHKTGNEIKTGNLTVNSIIKSGAPSTNILLAGGGDVPQFTLKYYAEPVSPPMSSPIVNGFNSIAIGDNALANGDEMLVFGTDAGSSALFSSNSTFIGKGAGSGAYLVDNSTFIGNGAGGGTNIVSNSTFIGYNAGNLSSGNYNTLIGYQAGKAFALNQIGSNNIIIGTNISLPNGASDSINIGGVLFGFNTNYDTFSDPSTTNTPNGRIAINKANDNGIDTLQIGGTLNIGNVPTGTSINNLGIDINGRVVKGTSGDGSTLQYYAEPASPPTSSPLVNSPESIAIGSGAQALAAQMFVVGTNAGNGADDFYGSNLIGYNVGLNGISSPFTNLIGFQAGFAAYVCENSTFIGSSAGNSTSNCVYSNFIGANAGAGINGSLYSNFIGSSAGQGASSSYSSNFIGQDAGASANDSYSSNFIGQYAGQYANNAPYSNFIGNNAGNGAINSSYSNLFGYQAGMSFAGNQIGTNNIIIGTNISLPNGATNGINIGGVIFGFNTNSDTISTDPSITNSLNGRVAINKAIDDGVNTLQVDGSIVGTQLRVSALNAAPSSATATGVMGEIRFVNGFIYVCVATNTWQRTTLSSW